MINLNINFYLMKTISYSYLFLYIRTAKCAVIMLRNEFNLNVLLRICGFIIEPSIHCCNQRAKYR